MGLFEQMTGKEKEQSGSQAIISMMHGMAESAMEGGNYGNAVDTYKNILRLQPDATAQYNLGSLHAQGKGVEQDFKEAAYWFRQANLAGNEQAGKLCTKCMMDFAHQGFDAKTPEKFYTDMVLFVRYVFPDDNLELEVNRNLYALAGNHLNKKEYGPAVKLLRAAAEFGKDGYSQNYLAVLYNMGEGVEKNDLASLYWFDKAVDNHADVAQKDRDGMLGAYRDNFSPNEFYEEMMRLAGWCSIGSDEVPKDAQKAVFWRTIGEDRMKEAYKK